MVTSRSVYVCRMNCMNKSGSECNLPVDEGFLILAQQQEYKATFVASTSVQIRPNLTTHAVRKKKIPYYFSV